MHYTGSKNIESINLIDYNKYLSCPDCRACGLYCPKHREEVEKLLLIINDYNNKNDS